MNTIKYYFTDHLVLSYQGYEYFSKIKKFNIYNYAYFVYYKNFINRHCFSKRNSEFKHKNK